MKRTDRAALLDPSKLSNPSVYMRHLSELYQMQTIEMKGAGVSLMDLPYFLAGSLTASTTARNCLMEGPPA
jgi:hypothetical protein